jgi:hypothetical protein
VASAAIIDTDAAHEGQYEDVPERLAKYTAGKKAA